MRLINKLKRKIAPYFLALGIGLGAPVCGYRGCGNNPKNHPPRLDAIEDVVASEGDLIKVTPSAKDPDGDELSFDYSFPLDSNGEWQTNHEDDGNYNVIVGVSDGELKDYQCFEIMVNNVNRSPVLDLIGNKEVNENETLDFLVNGNDADGDNLVYSAIGLPDGTSFDSVGIFSWTPSYDQEGDYNVRFEVSDGDLIDYENVSIKVNDVNRAPSLDEIVDVIVNEGDLITINPSASDPDGDSLTYGLVNEPTGMTIDQSTGEIEWQTVYTDAGNHTTTVVVDDGKGGIDFQDVNVTVNDYFNISSNSVFEDDFEDGIIDDSLWVVGGGKREVWNPGGGSWQWWNEEIQDVDGYLQARTAGGTSGLTTGGEAWARTTYDFNDGKDYVVNFKWETGILGATYWDKHGIQITDGFTNWGGSVYDVWTERPGTVSLYDTYMEDTPIQDWSIKIDGTTKTAELYEGIDGTGTLHSSKQLDSTYPWHVRFMTADATSAGFPGGDVVLNLYHIKAEEK